MMAMVVIDPFEMIQVHHQDAVAVAVAAVNGGGDLQFFIHRSAITGAGQRVMDGQLLQLVALGAGAVGKDETEDTGHHAGDQK